VLITKKKSRFFGLLSRNTTTEFFRTYPVTIMSSTTTATATTSFSFPSKAESSRYSSSREESRGRGSSSRVHTLESPDKSLSDRISSTRNGKTDRDSSSTWSSSREWEKKREAASEPGPSDLSRRMSSSPSKGGSDISSKEKKMREANVYDDEVIIVRSLPNMVLKGGLIVASLRRAGIHGVYVLSLFNALYS